MRKSKIYIGFLFVLLMVSAFAAFYFYAKDDVYVSCIPTVIFLVAVYFLYKTVAGIHRDFGDFVAGVRYRDLSQRFSIQSAPIHLKYFRSGFNVISDEFKKLSFEKTTQYHYLQNVLELVDTAILAYDTSTGEIIWFNRLMKEYLRMPSLKNLNNLQRTESKLFAEIQTAPAKEQKVISIKRNDEEVKFLLGSSIFTSDEKVFKLIALQNIDETLDITESEAWKKLLRVLTHEIMNSIAPISSVAGTLQTRLEQIESSKKPTVSDFHDFKEGISTIKSRSSGLLKFSESYRNLNKIGSLNPSVFYVIDLFESLLTLMNPSLEQKNITLDIILKNPLLEIKADRELVEQTLINLILNAIDAVKDKDEKQILLIGEAREQYKPVLKVADNGNGMDKEILDKIFIPFFTTKTTGSGIGLSLCKQIMHLHKGSVQVKSVVGDGTVFSLIF